MIVRPTYRPSVPLPVGGAGAFRPMLLFRPILHVGAAAHKNSVNTETRYIRSKIVY